MNTTEILLALTPENYNVPPGEEKLFHVVMEVRQFDPNTGARKSKPTLQKFGFKEFSRNVEVFKKQGYTLTIVHNPEQAVKSQEKTKTPLMKVVTDETKPKSLKPKGKKVDVEPSQVDPQDPEEEDFGLEFKKL